MQFAYFAIYSSCTIQLLHWSILPTYYCATLQHYTHHLFYCITILYTYSTILYYYTIQRSYYSTILYFYFIVLFYYSVILYFYFAVLFYYSNLLYYYSIMLIHCSVVLLHYFVLSTSYFTLLVYDLFILPLYVPAYWHCTSWINWCATGTHAHILTTVWWIAMSRERFALPSACLLLILAHPSAIGFIHFTTCICLSIACSCPYICYAFLVAPHILLFTICSSRLIIWLILITFYIFYSTIHTYYFMIYIY